MKYFPHLSIASEDEDIVDVLEVHGPSGYGVYWIITEIVARNLKNPQDVPSVTMLRATWARKCFVRVPLFTKIVAMLSHLGKIQVEDEGDYLTIMHPKLLKYLDEYTRKVGTKSRQGQEAVPSVSGESPKRIEGSRIEEKRIKGKRRSTPPRADGPESSPNTETESEAEREKGLQTIRETIEKIGGNGAQKPERRVVELGEQLPEVETPEDLTQETVEKQQGLARLAIEPPLDEESIAAIINAWTGYRLGRFDQYALADTLNRLSIMGVERSKVYETLGVV